MRRRKYDVAVSFAGEKRIYVRKVVKALEQMGLKVFFDEKPECKLELWGSDLTLKLDDIYRKDSRYCIVFICDSYVKKPWTKYEHTVLRARNLHESDVSILPARFDRTELPGLHSTFGYIDISKMKSRDFAVLVYNKIKGCKLFNINPFYSLHGRGKYREAANYLENLFTSHYDRIRTKRRIWLTYNLSCAYSRLANSTDETGYLEKAFNYFSLWIGNIINLGDKDLADKINYFNQDDDLLYMRKKNQTKIKRLMRKFRQDIKLNLKPSGGGGCFPEGSLVQTPYGLKDITRMKLGDEIICYDIKKSLPFLTKVVKLHVHRCTLLYEINNISTTPKQRFFVYGLGWMQAKDMEIGMNLLTYENFNSEILRISKVHSSKKVFNIETDHPSHNYFVNGLLAHNKKV